MRDAPESDGLEPLREAASLVRFASLALDLDARTLARESGESVPLTRGEFALLRVFVTRPGRVISRDTLLGALANRRFEPFDRSVDVLIGRLRRKIEPDPKQPCLIVTIPGEGYRFDGLTKALRSNRPPPIANERHPDPDSGSRAASEQRAEGELAPEAEPATQAAADSAKQPTSGVRFGVAPLAAAIAALLILAAASGWFLLVGRSPKPAQAARLSVVVLPFENLSGDKEEDYFADGITDDLTTDLSHIADSFVIARGTAFTYRGKPIDAKSIGRELGVGHVLEGSVRRAGETIAVNAQLISTETGAQVWADRFDGERSKLGQLQVEFVSRLARSLDVELVKAESLRAIRERPDNPDAVDLAMRGWATLHGGFTKANWEAAMDLFERALRLDPELIRAQVGLALVLIDRVSTFGSGDRAADYPRAEALLAKALAKEPNNAWARFDKADLALANKRFNDALSELDLAIENDRNFANAYALRALTQIFVGRAAEAFPEVETAIRLSPRDDRARGLWEFFICDAHTHLAEWDQAVEWCRRSIATNPGYWVPYVDMAAANGWLGRDAEAKAAIGGLLKLMPGFTAQKALQHCPSDNPQYQREYARIVEGLRKAGLPEGEKTLN
jgi:TolB-like protein/DNA-binding winged helix-turn-helix (wHTH) protein